MQNILERNMQNVLDWIVIGGILLTGIIIFAIFVLLHKRYLNRRLKGDCKARSVPQPLIVFAVVIFSVCAFTIGYLSTMLTYFKSELDFYKTEYQKIYPRHIAVSDFELFEEYKEYRDALVNDTLNGYDITVVTDGDFVCYIGLPQATIAGYFFMPQYFVYVRYIDEPLDIKNVQMERIISYDADEQNDYGGMGTYAPELLLIGNTLEEDFYIRIKTIVKIAPRTQETKTNWDSLPIHAQSEFVISG